MDSKLGTPIESYESQSSSTSSVAEPKKSLAVSTRKSIGGIDQIQFSELEKHVSEPPPTQPRSTLVSIAIVLACTGTMILDISGVTAVSMAIPTIAKDLDMANENIPWIVSAFSLSSGCLLLLMGRFADLYGRKLLWLIGAFWIAIMTLGCSFARTGEQLIILRAMHGIGPAAMVPAAIGILAQSFPPSRARSFAYATFSAGAPLGGALGTVFGGVMAKYTSWRGVFWFSSALATAIALLGLLVIDPDSQHETSSDKRVDWIGALFITGGLVSVIFALSDASTRGWSSPLIISLLVLGAILIGVFLGWEHYLTSYTSYPPLMTLDIWTRANGQFAAMQAVAFMEWACFTTLTLWGMLYYQNYLRLDPVLTMLRFLPMEITGFICTILVAILVGRISGAYMLVIGATATSVAALLFAIIKPDVSYWAYGFPAAVLSILGVEFVFACGPLFISRIARPGEQSVAGALFQISTNLGTSFGLAITTIGQMTGMNAEARAMGIKIDINATALEIPPNVLLRGYRDAQWTSFVFGIAALVLVIAFLHGIGIVGSKPEKQENDVEKA